MDYANTFCNMLGPLNRTKYIMYDYENQVILGPDHEELNCRNSFVDELGLEAFLLCCCVLILYYPRVLRKA